MHVHARARKYTPSHAEDFFFFIRFGLMLRLRWRRSLPSLLLLRLRRCFFFCAGYVVKQSAAHITRHRRGLGPNRCQTWQIWLAEVPSEPQDMGPPPRGPKQLRWKEQLGPGVQAGHDYRCTLGSEKVPCVKV